MQPPNKFVSDQYHTGHTGISYTSIILTCKPCTSLWEGHIIVHWHKCKRSQQYWEHAYACQRSRASINLKFKLACKCLCKNKACHWQSVQTTDMLAPDVTQRRVSAMAQVQQHVVVCWCSLSLLLTTCRIATTSVTHRQTTQVILANLRPSLKYWSGTEC